jgi:hypothetical protein
MSYWCITSVNYTGDACMAGVIDTGEACITGIGDIVEVGDYLFITGRCQRHG